MRSVRLVASIAAAGLGGVLLAASAAATGVGLVLPPSQAGVYVYDLAQIWQASTRQAAQSVAGAVRDRTGAELAIVSWPTGQSSVSTATAEADARTIMDTWGVGRAGVNDGLVVLFDMDTSLRHGQIYLFTGAGFRERYLSDSEAAAIVNGEMLPPASDGDLDEALLAGLRAIDRVTQPGGNPDRRLQALLVGGSSVVLGGAAMLTFGGFLLTWWRRGRDSEIPLIDDSVLLPAPPPELTPALATVLRKNLVDDDAFSSALVDLGHRGLVTFRAGDVHPDRVDLVVPAEPVSAQSALDARRRPLGPAETRLYQAVRAAAHRETVEAPPGGERGELVVSSKSLREGAGKQLFEAFRGAAGEAAYAAGWFRDDPNAVTGRWVATGVGVAILAVVVGALFVIDKSDTANLVVAGREPLFAAVVAAIPIPIAIAALSRFMAARTVAGARTLAMALAYRNTLRYELAQARTVEAAVASASTRLPWITTPDALTVWAVAFGLKDEIDDLIKATFAEAARTGAGGWSPAWFSGADGVPSVGDLVGSISTSAASSSGDGYGGGSSSGGGGAGGRF